jgi:hypothetical protein
MAAGNQGEKGKIALFVMKVSNMTQRQVMLKEVVALINPLIGDR